MILKSFIKIFLSLAVILFALPSPAYAHLIGGNGLNSGLIHPLLGLDHLLAMIAVGVIGTQIGGRALWTVPLTFLSFMLTGGLLAILGISLPLVEAGIASSLLILGAVIAVSKKFPLSLAVACVALFALFHGHAHGKEIPTIVHPALYVTGFIVSTALLHTTGVLAGYYAQKTRLTFKLLKFSGIAISMAGIFFFVSAL